MNTSVEKRFKLLALFALHLEIWGDKMVDLANAIDKNHPQAEEALCYYEDTLINILEKDDEEFVFLKN
jgi:hypothetical protein